MKKIKEKILSINMTWPKVIIIAILSSIYTVVMLLIPGLKDTSFVNIGVCFECWVLLAIIIIVNSKNNLDAALKTFVFFLISQPLIYLLQVPFHSNGFGIFIHYKPWFIWTILTFPGAFIAYYVKKKNIFSVLILSVANLLLSFEFVTHLNTCINHFPRQLVASIFCILLMVFLIELLIDKKLYKVIGYVLIVCFIAIFFVISKQDSTVFLSTLYDLDKNTWEVEKVDNPNYNVSVDDKTLDISTNRCNNTYITLKDENNKTKKLKVTCNKETSLTIKEVK